MSKDECQHLELKKTTSKADDGAPIYYCKAKCGVGLLVVRPMEITVSYGRPPVGEQKQEEGV